MFLTLFGNLNAQKLTMSSNDFDGQYFVEQFADLQVLRYDVPGFKKLSLNEKVMIYYLYQAALSGRDMIYDQNYKHNLRVRKTLEAIVKSYKGDKKTEEYKQFLVYAKRFWFSNGIHHHYSTVKFFPECSKDYFQALIKKSSENMMPKAKGQSIAEFMDEITMIIYSKDEKGMKRVNKDEGVDVIKESATNFYSGLDQETVEDYYKKMAKTYSDKEHPISFGLNSQLIKNSKGQIEEKVWKVGGMYSESIEKVVFWLEKAHDVCQDELQKESLNKLIKFYKTGSLKDFDEYNIAWVKDIKSKIDVVNGFIEVYGDPLGYKGSFESVVSIKDMEATKRIDAISKQAQWFEDHSPIMEEHKKKNVKGISAKVITVVIESGDAAPTTPIGINLPNANWIRKEHGSKSVNLGNIVYAYEKAATQAGGGALEEFALPNEVELAKKYGSLADNLHTDMHEVIGHASGKINPGVGTPKETLKNYSSTLEEARADLVALYYLMDQKLIDIGVMKTLDVGKAAYNDYIRNGLMTQLKRIKIGDNLEEDHMRNRQLVAKWVYEKGKSDKVIEKKKINGKTYFVINDYKKLQKLFGDLLKEIQRIKSEGDYKSAKKLVETYGVKVDTELHKEVLERFKKVKTAAYSGFIYPKLTPIKDKNGKIINVNISYPKDFVKQMIEYGDEYSFLPFNLTN